MFGIQCSNCICCLTTALLSIVVIFFRYNRFDRRIIRSMLKVCAVWITSSLPRVIHTSMFVSTAHSLYEGCAAQDSRGQQAGSPGLGGQAARAQYALGRRRLHRPDERAPAVSRAMASRRRVTRGDCRSHGRHKHGITWMAWQWHGMAWLGA